MCHTQDRLHGTKPIFSSNSHSHCFQFQGCVKSQFVCVIHEGLVVHTVLLKVIILPFQHKLKVLLHFHHVFAIIVLAALAMDNNQFFLLFLLTFSIVLLVIVLTITVHLPDFHSLDLQHSDHSYSPCCYCLPTYVGSLCMDTRERGRPQQHGVSVSAYLAVLSPCNLE